MDGHQGLARWAENMIDSSGRRFIGLLDPQRDGLYTRALAATGSAGSAETCIQRAVRGAFREFVQGQVPREFPAWMQRHLEDQIQAMASTELSVGATTPTVPATDAMPADVWARVAAAIQIESVKIHGATEEGDEALLAYDPLLVPKKKSPPTDDLSDGLNLSPWSRFVVAAAIVLIIGVVATVVLTTHHAPPEGQTPATQPTTTRPVP